MKEFEKVSSGVKKGENVLILDQPPWCIVILERQGLSCSIPRGLSKDSPLCGPRARGLDTGDADASPRRCPVRSYVVASVIRTFTQVAGAGTFSDCLSR